AGMTPAHSAKSTMEIIQNERLSTWDKNVWPGNSPDFNVIEHLWHELQDSVLGEPRPTNRDELVARIMEKWESFSAEKLEGLVESFPKRIEACKQNKDGNTKY